MLWRKLTPREVKQRKAVQRCTFDKKDAEEDGLKLSKDSSLCSIGAPVRIYASTVEEFGDAMSQAFPNSVARRSKNDVSIKISVTHPPSRARIDKLNMLK